MSEVVQDYARKEFIIAMMKVEHAHGKDTTTVLVEAQLKAIAIYLTGSIGAEDAFEMLQRHADSIVDRRLAKTTVRVP